jgi:hypothetical protein
MSGQSASAGQSDLSYVIFESEFFMGPHQCATRLGLLLVLAVTVNLSEAACAAVVWTGPTLTFTKTGAIQNDVNDPANQDRMTANVWLTRASSQGMINIKKETLYDGSFHTSPADTLWATDLVPGNGNATIAATNWQNLTFTTWADAYGGPGSSLQGNITTHNAVVKLVTDNIYLDLMFTGFSSGGFFIYDRSTGVSAPSPTGDYNHNNAVDAGDYVIWRRTLGNSASPAGSGADGNANGTIDPGDYTYWRARFGNAPAGLGAGSDSIPEPSPIRLGLQLIAVVLCAFRWRSLAALPGATIKNQTKIHMGNL